jgi:hypothetical protein
LEVFVFFRAAARPGDHHSIDLFPLPDPEGHGQLGLRKITRTSTHEPRLALITDEDTDRSPDGVVVGFRSLQFETDAAVARELIVSKEDRGTIVGGHQDIQITVAVEISVGQAAADFWSVKSTASVAGDVSKLSVSEIQEELWRLCVPNISADISNGLVDVAIRGSEIQIAVKIHVQKKASEAQSIF